MPRFAKAITATVLAASVLSVSLIAVDAGNLHQIKQIVKSVTDVASGDTAAKDPYLNTTRHANRTRYTTCRFEKRERWSKRRGELVMRNTKVCS